MSLRCTTHFHACDCREEKFKELEQRLKEKDEVIMSQEKERQSTERFWKEKFEKLQSQIDEANKKYLKKEEGK